MNTTEFASAMSYFPVEERAAVLDKYIIINLRPSRREAADDDFPEWKTELIHVDDFKNTCIKVVDDSYSLTTWYSIERKDQPANHCVSYCIWGAVLNEHKIENPWPGDAYDVIDHLGEKFAEPYGPYGLFDDEREAVLSDIEHRISEWDDSEHYISRDDLKRMLELP